MRKLFNIVGKVLSTATIAAAALVVGYTILSPDFMTASTETGASVNEASLAVESTATFVAEPTSTAEPTATETTVIVITVEPTLSTQTRVLADGFAQVHASADEIPYLKWDVVEIVKVVDGVSTTISAGVYNVTAADCKTSLIDNAKKVYKAYKAIGADWHVVAAKTLTESAFIQFKEDKNGQCKLLQNYAGAPAYCMMQMYLPAHPTLRLEDLADIDYCIAQGVEVFREKLSQANGDNIQAVACYKGFCQEGYYGKNDSGFKNNFDKAYNSSGFTLEGQFIPFDEEELLQKFPDWR